MQLQAHACTHTHTRAAAKDADRQVSTDELSRVWSMRFSDGSLRVCGEEGSASTLCGSLQVCSGTGAGQE